MFTQILPYLVKIINKENGKHTYTLIQTHHLGVGFQMQRELNSLVFIVFFSFSPTINHHNNSYNLPTYREENKNQSKVPTIKEVIFSLKLLF